MRGSSNLGALAPVIVLVACVACSDDRAAEAPATRGPTPEPALVELLQPLPVARVDREPATRSPDAWIRWLAPLPRGTELWEITSGHRPVRALVAEGFGPTVVILPHLAGTERIARYLLARLSEAGLGVLAILPEPAVPGPSDDADAFLALLLERIHTGRLGVRLVDEGWGPRCLAVVGVSLGGMTAVPVAALEPKVHVLVSMLGGAAITEMAPASAGPPTPSQKLAIMAVDPSTWAPLVRSKSPLIVEALWDRVVPKPSRRALWRALSPSGTRIVYPAGHGSFAAFLPHAATQAIRHIEAVCEGLARRSISTPNEQSRFDK